MRKTGRRAKAIAPSALNVASAANAVSVQTGLKVAGLKVTYDLKTAANPVQKAVQKSVAKGAIRVTNAATIVVRVRATPPMRVSMPLPPRWQTCQRQH